MLGTQTAAWKTMKQSGGDITALYKWAESAGSKDCL